MNYPATRRSVSNPLTKRVRSKVLAMNPERFKFHQILQSLPVGPFRSVFVPSERFAEQVDGSRALPAPTRISPAPTTDQKQH